MPDEPIHLEQLDGEWRLRADLMTYLGSLFIEQLGELLGQLPEPSRVALMHNLSERRPTGPGAGGLATAAGS